MIDFTLVLLFDAEEASEAAADKAFFIGNL